MRKPMLADIDMFDLNTNRWTARNDGPKTGAEFLSEEMWQEKALDDWMREVADPLIDAMELGRQEGRTMLWGDEEVRITRNGLRSAMLAEGALPVAVFFGMLSRQNYRVTSDGQFADSLRSSFTVIGQRLRVMGRGAR